MASKKNEQIDIIEKKRHLADEIYNTAESLVSAFVIALILVTFVVRPYIIPTGSMADTLRGAHFRLRCGQCGYRYDHNFDPGQYNMAENTIPKNEVPVNMTRCPSCGYFNQSPEKRRVTKGDKILALKCWYQFFEPRRWDTVVFCYPVTPQIKYIKRLVGLPGEKVEIIDGDIYINDEIARKPAKVQEELWMPVYDHDFAPARPGEGLFNRHRWQMPFNVEGSKWSELEDGGRGFRVDSEAGDVSELVYNTEAGNDFKASYAYDNLKFYEMMPICSDIKVRFVCDVFPEGGLLGISLSKNGINYRGIATGGQMRIERENEAGGFELLTEGTTSSSGIGEKLEFANVDHMLVLKFGKESIVYDLGRSVDAAGEIDSKQPVVKILGSDYVEISHVAIFRDIHYTGDYMSNDRRARASRGNAVNLKEDEFFFLGDNSPISGDSRWWSEMGKGNDGMLYPAGIVPREYFIGKAFVVFWPSGYRPLRGFPFSLVPYAGKLKWIYGGSEESYAGEM